MAWQRKGGPPGVVRITLNIVTADHPELASWVWGMQWGKGATTVRDTLSSAVKGAGIKPFSSMSTTADVAVPVVASKSTEVVRTSAPVKAAAETRMENKVVEEHISEKIKSMNSIY